VTDSETGNSEADVIVQKADSGISGIPEYNRTFSISHPATWCEHADGDSSSANIIRWSVQIKPDAHSTCLAHEDFTGRHLKHDNYFIKLKNGERVERCWLVYSKKADAVICYCCKIYSPTQNNLCNDGFHAW
jgi:hypothetical protein